MELQESIRQHPELSAWWEAAARGEFVLPHCDGCGRSHWYPRTICPHCGDSAIRQIAASGTGTLYSVTVNRMGPTPFAVAYVELTEGPRLLANIETDAPDALQIGSPVRLRISAEPGAVAGVPVFIPA